MFSKRAFNARRRKTQALAKKPVKVANEKPTTEIFVNQTVIPFKKTCDFCEEKRAVFHCPKCTTTATGTGDFLCDSCDLEVHRHVKRRNHIRTQIPDVTAREAVHKIMGCFKYLLARKVLVAKCRLEFQRFFDPPTKTYFYFRPSIQVWNSVPYSCRGDGVHAVRSVARPRRRERGRGAARGLWRRTRGRAYFGAWPSRRPSRRTRIAAVREKHAIAERDKANTTKTNAGDVLAQAPLPQGGGALPLPVLRRLRLPDPGAAAASEGPSLASMAWRRTRALRET